MNLKQFDLYGWNALKGQKLLAQGNALGIKAVSKSPCVRAKALNFAWNFKAFALTGRAFKIRLKFGTFFSRIIGLTN